jgi:hypothetical protein
MIQIKNSLAEVYSDSWQAKRQTERQIYNLFTTELQALTKKNFNCIDFEVFCDY